MGEGDARRDFDHGKRPARLPTTVSQCEIRGHGEGPRLPWL
jgi:hypothetical protein